MFVGVFIVKNPVDYCSTAHNAHDNLNILPSNMDVHHANWHV